MAPNVTRAARATTRFLIYQMVAPSLQERHIISRQEGLNYEHNYETYAAAFLLFIC